jgi:hypothetical protein
MSGPGTGIAVAAGLLVTVLTVFPLFKLFMGGCFFEQGCGEYEGIQVIGVILVSCIAGMGTAYGLGRILRTEG